MGLGARAAIQLGQKEKQKMAHRLPRRVQGLDNGWPSKLSRGRRRWTRCMGCLQLVAINPEAKIMFPSPSKGPRHKAYGVWCLGVGTCKLLWPGHGMERRSQAPEQCNNAVYGGETATRACL
jgi:hypothetical protein